ncbi:hypothetical protein GQ457_13G013030 [Hibiscus cannabinus]
MIWEDKWVPSLPNFKISSLRPDGTGIYLVKQLINRSETSWNIPLLHSLFSRQEVRAIVQIPVCSQTLPDILVWHYSNSGEYTVKLGYHWLMENKRQIHEAGSSRQNEKNGEYWSHIWKLKTSPKIQNFIWKACHNVVPSNENLARRHHSRTSSCLRCGDPNKSLEHILFLCPLSQAIWRASAFHYSPSLQGFRSFDQWWQDIRAMFPVGDPFSYDSLMAWTVWGIWKARNAWIFEGSRENLIHIWNCIFKEFGEFQHHHVLNRSNSSPSRDPSIWSPPPPNFIKVNCDASFNSSRKLAGIAAIARNCHGDIVDGINAQVHSSSAFVAECLALRLGSSLIRQHSWQHVQVEYDCKLAIDMINCQSIDSWDVKAVLSDIRLSVELLSNVTFSYIYRTSNQVADWVARTTCKGTCPYNWMRLTPPELLSLM